MAVKVFTNADIDFVSATASDAAWTAAAAGFSSMEGDSGVVIDAVVAGPLMSVAGTLHDDASLPTDLLMSNVRMEFDWEIVNVGGGTPGSTIGGTVPTAGGGGDPGTTTGHAIGDANPSSIFGGLSRADVFAVAAIGWGFSASTACTSRRIIITNFTVTISYVSLSTGWLVKVNGLTNPTGATNGAFLPDAAFVEGPSATGGIDLDIYDTAGAFIFLDGSVTPVDVAGLPAGFTPADAYSAWNYSALALADDTIEYDLSGVFDFLPPFGAPADYKIEELTGMTLTALSGLVGSTIAGTMTSPTLTGRATIESDTGLPSPPTFVFFLQGEYTIETPTFTSLTPTSGTVAGGTLVTLTGTFFDVGMTVNFDGSPATVEGVFAGDTKMTVRTPAHAVGLVDVEVVGVGTLTNAYTYVAVISVTPNRGTIDGSTPVTIRGGGFLAATGVEFDGTPVLSYVIVSDTTITAVTPPHAAGAVDVDVLTVGTGVGLYTYIVKGPLKLPPIPVTSPVAQQGGGGSPIGGKAGTKATQDTMSLAHVRYQMALKKAVEDQSN